jgi:hypothetical protein
VEIEAEPVNGWMRGFQLPPGEHHLTIYFRPRRFFAGAIESLLAVAVGGVLLLRRSGDRGTVHVPVGKMD